MSSPPARVEPRCDCSVTWENWTEVRGDEIAYFDASVRCRRPAGHTGSHEGFGDANRARYRWRYTRRGKVKWLK